MNFIDLLGWISTALIILGYFFNSRLQHRHAMVSWIVGDIGWIWYDVVIMNWSHMTLSVMIIVMNIYGIIKISK